MQKISTEGPIRNCESGWLGYRMGRRLFNRRLLGTFWISNRVNALPRQEIN